MKTHLAYIYRKIRFKLTIMLACFGFKQVLNNSELSGFSPQTTSQAC